MAEKEYIEREKIEKFFNSIYDCADLTFEPNDHCCAADDCFHCKWHETMNAIKKRILSFHAADAIEQLCNLCADQSKDCSKAIAKYLELWAKQPRWIPVTERLPESMHEYVLCCGEKGGQFVGWVGEGMIVNGKARAFQHGGRGRYITHWMPLPEPPKEET